MLERGKLELPEVGEHILNGAAEERGEPVK